ncbi:hypothetical protein UA38_17035 [Photobacterium kishitanii]|uniref:Uncharacterized protein n=1 Tax=Photobacterium kishitanii TaxID=318456 RepID=A0AAX0YRU0_9GAMM|nr:hypothetical protein [Photobacterium kishitanii]KJG08601.1 hypothetical protein UB40_17210 [Photobacterium kishitanii]KJG55956.1 hypothetical protein UA38_17035 [Photobacterium kishitanii]KJG59180.1 hypothetical protein UA42_18455 [Photobacterium kishitanii]KJG64161.1 hypothetical protein UA40_18165 [Photobacterium kishitanii]KJG68260.1 hypothetical protein UA41_18055 [Photobacterium kishitanii]
MSIADKLLDINIAAQVKRDGAVNVLESIYEQAGYAHFKRVKWGRQYYDGIQFADGSVIAVKPTAFNCLTLVKLDFSNQIC